ncbi:hypothetical protein SPONL_1937 [uncultured Candidatus Thioglobus sp.]|nr:hypothetical protein SPONL_1937 [uncultured Candidatus Thioglobus sp.]
MSESLPHSIALQEKMTKVASHTFQQLMTILFQEDSSSNF